MKKIISKMINNRVLKYLFLVYRYKQKNKSIVKTIIFALEAKVKFYMPSLKISKGCQINKLFKKVNIKINEKYNFIYNIDIYKSLNNKNVTIENLSLDYSIILSKSLNDFKEEINKMTESELKIDEMNLIESIELYIDRIISKIKLSKISNKEKLINYFNNIKTQSSETFEESIQRILFYNSIMWQTGHALNGLGRLDQILEKYYNKDIKNKIINKSEAKKMIIEMFNILHDNYWWKSNSLIGDTGQIIILGGKIQDGSYFCNDLTYMFIEIVKELKKTDPKILLRVSSQTPRKLIEEALQCIQTGNGSPLFSNDDIVIQRMIDFGYEEKDSYNYVVSACWEPFISGKSFDQNNIGIFNFIEPFVKMFEKEDIVKIVDYNVLLELYKKYLKEYIHIQLDEMNNKKWEIDPILSLFTSNCIKNEKDISQGGAKYNNYGLTSVALGNTVNSIYNIKKFVFDDKKISLEDFNNYRINNFKGHEDILIKLKNQPIRYGTDNEEIIALVNEITSCANEEYVKTRNSLKGKYKFGLSSPAYINSSINFPATFDGRKNGDSFLVHISSDKECLPYTELIGFASRLNYKECRFNGNVIDFMINPTFINNQFDKMVDFINLSIKKGFYQMQMNVIDSETLINAKKNPEIYKDLIVRVWGFSAYFNDLPENYKDLLIERALINEGKSN